MMHIKWTYRFVLATCLLTPLYTTLVFARSITLQQAESAALLQSPEIKSDQATSRALKQSAIASGQLADPKLMLGTMNIPVDTFNFNQEPMTQIQVGLQQNFPRGRSLHYLSLQKNNLSMAMSHKQQTTRLQVLQGVRVSWLTLYYWLHAKKIILKQKSVFQHLLKVTKSMLANNKAQQKDVIRAQLELTELDNRLLEINQQIESARASLSRWIGPRLAQTANPQQLPGWKSPRSLSKLAMMLKKHPILKTDAATISASHAGVKLAHQQYLPGFMAGVTYGFRQGKNIDGSMRADFLSANVSLDLPLFPHNRQNRTLKASEQSLLATKQNQLSHYRELCETLKKEYSIWQQQRKSTQLYKMELVPEAKQYAEATMIAYQNTKTDFPTLARAYVRELNTELAALKTDINREMALAKLLYLQGN